MPPISEPTIHWIRSPRMEGLAAKADGKADPTDKIPGMAPNMGQHLLPHVITFQGLLTSIGKVYRPSDEALRDSYDNARFMRADPMIMECIEMRRRSVALLDWHLEPEDAKDQKQKDLCAELTRILQRIPRFMQYRDVLADAIWYGRYAVKQRFNWTRVGYERRLGIDRWMPLHGDKLVFGYDDMTGEYDADKVGIRVSGQYNPGGDDHPLWLQRASEQISYADMGMAYFLKPHERPMLAIHKHMIEDGEYEDIFSAGRVNGVGIRHRLYWTWYQKQEALAWLMEYLERSAFGLEIWYYPWGNEQARLKTLEAATERIGQGRNVVLVPRVLGESAHAYGVEKVETGLSGADVVERIVKEFFGHQIKRYILGQTLTTEASNTGLGSNTAGVHLDTYMQIVTFDATNEEETLTTDTVAPVKLFNFPRYADVPVRFKIDTQAADVESKLKAWREAYEMGVKLKSQDVMDMIGSAKPGPDDEVLDIAAKGGGMGMGGMPGMPPGMGAPGGNGQPGGPPANGKPKYVNGTDFDQAPDDAPDVDQDDPAQYAADQGNQAIRSIVECGGVWLPSDVYAKIKAGVLAERGNDPGDRTKVEPVDQPAARYSKESEDWEEEKHPRDQGGKFSSSGTIHPKHEKELALAHRTKVADDAGKHLLQLAFDPREKNKGWYVKHTAPDKTRTIHPERHKSHFAAAAWAMGWLAPKLNRTAPKAVESPAKGDDHGQRLETIRTGRPTGSGEARVGEAAADTPGAGSTGPAPRAIGGGGPGGLHQGEGLGSDRGPGIEDRAGGAGGDSSTAGDSGAAAVGAGGRTAAPGGLGGGGGGRGSSGGGESSLRPVDPHTDISAGNWHYRHPATVFSHGKKAKYRDNIAAIRTLKAIELEGRTQATPEEQEILSRYVGWGQFPEVFGYLGTGWEKERAETRDLLDPEEYAAAKGSTTNAHYTHPDVVAAQWKMAERLGYKGGRYLEPAVGAGYYLGLMPEDLAKKTRTTAVEMDKTSGRIAQHLYPAANVAIAPFQQHPTPDNFYDLVATNVPFDNAVRPHDSKYNKYHANLHDYYFLRAADTTKPGGLAMLITSTGTMDNVSPMVQRKVNEELEFVSAIRFPGDTHAENAGTSVVTDMLIFRKKDPSIGEADPEKTPDEAQPDKVGFTGTTTDSLGRLYHWQDGKRVPGPKWDQTTLVPSAGDGEPIKVNKYFADHPEQVLGTLDRTGTMWAGEQMNVTKTEDYEERLQAAIDRLPAGIVRTDASRPAEERERIETSGEYQPGAYVEKDGKLYQYDNGALVEANENQPDTERIKGQLAIRDAARAVLAAQRRGEATEEPRADLNRLYDAYVSQHGPLSDKENKAAMKTDPDSQFMLSLESKSGGKADIFSKDTVRQAAAAEKADTVAEALGITLHEQGSIDLDRISALLGKSRVETAEQLVAEGVAFEDPSSGWKPAAEYLSGNVRQKLIEAKAAAANDPRYMPNVEALEAHQPEDVEYQDIGAKIGSPWVPSSDVEDFAAYMVGGGASASNFDIAYIPELGVWQANYAKGRHVDWVRDSQSTIDVWGIRNASGTLKAGFMDLLEHALTDHKLVIHGPKDEDGRAPIDREATEAAQQKIQEIKDKFKEWLWEDESRRDRLHRYYNDNFNSIVPMRYDGSHLTFPGMADSLPGIENFKLYPAQRDFVWRVITTGKGLAAHEVGTGKTNSMVAAAMELRRLGLAKKPALAVLKSNIEQITLEAHQLYPDARILSTNDMFEQDKRRETLSRIATGDYDLVIMTHDHLEAMQMRKETIAPMIEAEVRELEAAKLAAWENNPKKDNRIVKRLEKAKQKLTEELRQVLSQDEKDSVFFEDSGIDQLFVDEAHKFKSLPVYTAGDPVKGVPSTRSDRATDMYARTRWLMKQNGGRGVVFATGTPIANTMAELYNMQRYLQPDALEERGIKNFDAWKNTYGEVQNTIEFTLDGDMKPVSRFSEFVNLPELRHLASEMMDVQRAANMQNNQGGKAIKRPHRTDHVVISDPSPAVSEMMKDLTARAAEVKHQRRAEKGGDNMFVICGDGKKGSVDMRLYRADAEDDPGSKANQCVKNVVSIYNEHPGKTQCIFSNVGVHPNKWGFSVFHDMTEKLVKAGIQREKIANFAELKGPARDLAQTKMKRGEIAIAFGSTERLGTGTNVQTQLRAIHHLDVPYVPADIEQRDGRGWRSGNKNENLDIYKYVQQDSLDHAFWQLVARKSHFINQYMVGKGSRSMRDEETETLTPEQLMAVATGDESVLDRVNLEDEVRRLRQRKDRHSRDKERLKHSIESATAGVPELHEKRERHEKAAAHFEARPEFELQLASGGSFTERPEATEAFKKVVETASQEMRNRNNWERDPIKLGTYRGANLWYTDKGFVDVEMPDGTASYQAGASLGSVEAMVRAIKGRASDAAEAIASRHREIETMRQSQDAPFRQAAELEEKEAKLKELSEAIVAKRKAKREQYSLRNDLARAFEVMGYPRRIVRYARKTA